MAKVRSYEPGTVSWIDVSGRETTKSAEFYRGLFGWEAVSQGPAEESGGYAVFQRDGQAVAGIGPGEHPAWTVYFAVVDVAAAVARAVELGGSVMLDPLVVPSPITGGDAGTMAVLADPAGAPFAVWQGIDLSGADVTREPGSYRWAELATRDVEGAKAFYGALLGWQGTTHPFGGGTSTYTELHRSAGPPDEKVAGVVEMNEMWPAEVPSHWMVYIAVADTDATARRAAELGGTVSVEPFDLPVGRIAVLNDTEGAVFSVMAPPA